MHSLRRVFGFYLATHLVNTVTPTKPAEPQSEDPRAFHIAIIGAGVAGASVAFSLRRLLTSGIEQYQDTKISVYESSPVVGGQVKTIFPPGSERALEAGASHFFEDDWCLSDSARSLDLEYRAVPKGTGTMIWNGFRLLEDRFCSNEEIRAVPRFWDQSAGVWKMVKDFVARPLASIGFDWEHGAVLLKLQHEITTMQNRLKLFGKKGVFDSVQDELDNIELRGTMECSARQFLDTHAIPGPLQMSMVQPCVEALFGVNIEQAVGLHVVASMGSTRPQPVAILSGNAKLITRMLNESAAELYVDSQVIQVETGNQRRFALTIASTKSTRQTREEYDVVIFTGNSMVRLRPRGSESSSAASQHHVTHFSTLNALDPKAFGPGLGLLPSSILTTANSSYLDDETHVVRLITMPDFYIDRSGCDGDDECDQFLRVHRIDSRDPVSEAKLQRMADGTRNPGSNPIMWIDSRSWDRRRPVDNISRSGAPAHNIETEPNIFNTDTSIIDTMEMSCRMGRNVALKLLQQTKLVSNGLKVIQLDGPW